jgi:hypothetical protein
MFAPHAATACARTAGRRPFPQAYGAFGAGAATDQWALRNFQRPSRRSATAVK